MTLQDLSATHIYMQIYLSRLVADCLSCLVKWTTLGFLSYLIIGACGISTIPLQDLNLKNVKHFFLKPDYLKDVICQNLVQSYSSLKQKAVYYSKQVDGWTYATHSNTK